jgi:hypothetical protein
VWKLVSPSQAKKHFGENAVVGTSFPDEKKKTVAETSFDWNLIFFRKTKNNIREVGKKTSNSLFVFCRQKIA